MTELTRREFVIGAGALTLAGCGSGPSEAPAPPAPEAAVDGLSKGAGASAELMLENGVLVPAGWSARGGSHRVELTSSGVMLHVPTRSPLEVSFSELRMGLRHDYIRQHFGHATLAALMRRDL
ncbi:MAG TPA: hypothetical protein VM686_07300 [Polyangiaceae bacterium]|nr:hypothetical protein [Polyangiaceae bacterium]